MTINDIIEEIELQAGDIFSYFKCPSVARLGVDAFKIFSDPANWHNKTEETQGNGPQEEKKGINLMTSLGEIEVIEDDTLAPDTVLVVE